MPFNQFKGSAISCLLKSETEKIINFVDVESNLCEFRDNLGTNLIDPNSMHGNGFGLMYEISKDRTALLFNTAGSNLPSKKANSIFASGEIVVKTATKTINFSVQNVDFVKGTIIKTPFAEFEI